MKRFLLLLSLLLGFIWVGLQIRQDPGYVLIAVHSWSIEMPFWAAVLLLITLFIILYSLLRILSATGSLGGRFRLWLIRRRKQKAQNLTSQGLIELAEGRWDSAENNLLRAAVSSEAPLINYLAAACAAQEQHAYDRRDEYLRSAHQSTPGAEIAVGVVQAQLQVNHQQWERALASLRHILELSPKHHQVLRLLKDVYLQLRDWTQLSELLPRLRKTKAISAAEADALQRAIYREELLTASRSAGFDVVRGYWQSLPRDLHKEVEFLRIYVPAALAHNSSSEAEIVLREALKKVWDDELIRWYGIAEGDDAAKQLALAETWLKMYPENAALLLSAGRLCIRNQLWGKARSYLEFSLQLRPTAETYLLLGELLAKLGEQATSVEYFHKGLLETIEIKL